MLIVTQKDGKKIAYQMSIADITNLSDALMGTLRPARKLVFKRFLAAIQDVKRIHSFEAKKYCSCGNAHNLNGFQSLPYVGDMVDDVEILELRTCARCKSTIAYTMYSTDPETIKELEQ
jgi:hypothetical protein